MGKDSIGYNMNLTLSVFIRDAVFNILKLDVALPVSRFTNVERRYYAFVMFVIRTFCTNKLLETFRCVKRSLYLKTTKSPRIIIQVSCLLPQTYIFWTDIVSRKACGRTDNADMLLIGACLDDYHHATGPGLQHHIVSHIS